VGSNIQVCDPDGRPEVFGKKFWPPHASSGKSSVMMSMRVMVL
jgi:hypothetical protein